MGRTSRADAVRLRVDLRLQGADGRVLGPGRVELLERIERLRSIAAAAREMGMSYRHAWLLVEYTNRAFVAPLVAAKPGGARGGGTTLTPTGRRVLRAYRRLLGRVETAARGELATIAGLLRGSRPSSTSGRRGAPRRGARDHRDTGAQVAVP